MLLAWEPGEALSWLFSSRRKALTLLEYRNACLPMPNVGVNRRSAAGRLGPVGENVLRTADRAKLTCRDASGWTTG